MAGGREGVDEQGRQVSSEGARMEISSDKISKKQAEELSRKQAKEALLRSGYLLESRLETVLRKQDYYVEANTAYPDPDTGKSRELDLYAMSARQAGPDELDFLFTVLLIECVNNPQPIAFITKEPQVGVLHHYEVKLAGLPVKIAIEEERDLWEFLPNYLGMDKYHHYCKGRVATQFCSFIKKRDDEWMATHEGSHFDCFRKLCAAVDHFVDEHFKRWSFGDHEPINIEFYYPVVVVQGELIDVRTTKTSVKLVQASHIQYRRSAFMGTKATDYQIDVVTERFFPRYLEIIDQEISKTARLLGRRHKVVRKSIDKIARSTKRLRSPAKIRAAMEF